MSTRTMVTTMALLLLAASGCAKTPAMTTASAPAPTGAVSTAGARPTTPVASRSDRASNTVQISSRPSVKDFAPIGDVRDIHFDFDKYDVRADAQRILDANASWLKSHANQLLLVEGHCDERGTNEYNLALGERRAKATMNYLVSRGVDARRITVISYGEDRPQCQEHNEACWAKNRRSHLLVKGE